MFRRAGPSVATFALLASLSHVVSFSSLAFAQEKDRQEKKDPKAPRSDVEADWRPLFDGHTLDGWEQHGGKATYRVEDGSIVGTTALNTPNSFLTTKRLFGDFILELEYLVDPHMNSGVQIRSQVRPDDRVYGYQVEIDPSDRAWSGGIYDESRRGWLNDLLDNEPARKAFRQGEWNHYRVECVGDSIRTWINGVPAADLRDAETLVGFIALQVHNYNPKNHPEKKEHLEVRWRNIRIQDLGRHVWAPRFDGKTLRGFTSDGGGDWAVVDGKLRGTNSSDRAKHGHLFLDKPVGDFTARIRFRSVKGNSGFYFRTERGEGDVGILGFQAEIDPANDVGGIYETRGRAWVAKPSERAQKAFRPGEWNTLVVSAHGRRTVVTVNGIPSVDLRDDPGRTAGLAAVQIHGGQDVEVWFEAIDLLVPESPSAR